MTVTAEQVRVEVNAQATTENATMLAAVLVEAEGYVDTFLRDNLTDDEITDLPAWAIDKAVLVTAVDLYGHRKARNGIINEPMDLGDGTVANTQVRINRDPLAAARLALSPYVIPAIG
jgi:hypothetical protein